MGVFVVVIMALIPAAKVGMRRIWLVIGLLLCAGMIWQRTLINAHWLSDSITGVIGGVGVGLIMWWAFWPLLKRDESRPWRIGRTAK
jgi:undecaprenyl-diphosphatase